MQKGTKIFSVLAGIASLGIFISSCTKFTQAKVSTEGTIYMPQAYSERSDLSLVLIDTAQNVSFGAAYGGLNYPSHDIAVTFKIDTTLIAAYNATNGTSYIALPAASYSVASLSSVIKAGKTSSDPLYVGISTSTLSSTTQYMLPVTLTSAASGKIDSSLQTSYFRIDHLDNIYAGSYHTIGTRHNYNADGSDGGTSSIDDTRVLSTMSSDSCSINTIANLGAYNGTVFYVRVNSDNTLEFSGKLQNDPGAPIANQPGAVSTFDPATRVFTVHYMYTNTNGTYRMMDEVWTPQ
jgi:hypothetical protein